jgi:hypothetical protein
MRADFIALLRDAAGVAAIVPANAIGMEQVVQGTVYPAIVCSVVSGSEGVTHDGPEGLTMARMQVDCYALDYGQADAIATAVKTALNGHRGGRFGGVFQESERDSREGGANDAERPYRISLDFMVNWRN